MFLPLIFALLAVIAPIHALTSGGCQKSLNPKYTPGEARRIKIKSPSGGGIREALVHLPQNYEHTPGKGAPVIVALHGKNQNAAGFEAETGFSDMAINGDSIVVYPQGLNNMWTGDPAAPEIKDVNDIEFTSNLLDHLESTLCIQRGRIYAAGYSNGGGLASLIACHPFASQRFAAFAAVSGAFYKEGPLRQPLFEYCSTGRVPMPIMEIHGDADKVVDYEGENTPDGPSLSIPDWLKVWEEANYCQTTTADDSDGHKDAISEQLVRRIDSRCSNYKRQPIVHYKLQGAGHEWHRGPLNASNGQSRAFDTTAVVVQWFNEHIIEDIFLEALDHESPSSAKPVEEIEDTAEKGSDVEDEVFNKPTSTHTIRMTVVPNVGTESQGAVQSTVHDEL